MWSNQRCFTVDHGEVPEALSLVDVRSGLKDIISSRNDLGSALDKHMSFEGSTGPEVVLAFVASKLGTSDFGRKVGAYSLASNSSDSSVQNLLANSQSSLVAPYVYAGRPNKLSDQLVDAATSVAPKARILLGQLDDHTDQSHVSGCDALLSSLNEEPALLSNGIADLVLLQGDTYDAAMGECMNRMISAVSQKNARYVAVLTADAPSVDVNMEFPAGPSSALPLHYRRLLTVPLQDNTNGNYTGPQYITPTILWALLLGFFLLFILWTAISCLMTVETPVRFAEEPPRHSLSKEY